MNRTEGQMQFGDSEELPSTEERKPPSIADAEKDEKTARLGYLLAQAEGIDFPVPLVDKDTSGLKGYFDYGLVKSSDNEVKHHQLYEAQITQRLAKTFTDTDDITDLAEAYQIFELEPLEVKIASHRKDLEGVREYIDKHPEAMRSFKEKKAINDELPTLEREKIVLTELINYLHRFIAEHRSAA